MAFWASAAWGREALCVCVCVCVRTRACQLPNCPAMGVDFMHSEFSPVAVLDCTGITSFHHRQGTTQYKRHRFTAYHHSTDLRIGTTELSWHF